MLVYLLPVVILFQDNPCHDSMADKVCNEILSNPHSFQLRLWTRILNQLSLSADNGTHLKALAVLCQQMLQVGTCLSLSCFVLSGRVSLSCLVLYGLIILSCLVLYGLTNLSCLVLYGLVNLSCHVLYGLVNLSCHVLYGLVNLSCLVLSHCFLVCLVWSGSLVLPCLVWSGQLVLPSCLVMSCFVMYDNNKIFVWHKIFSRGDYSKLTESHMHMNIYTIYCLTTCVLVRLSDNLSHSVCWLSGCLTCLSVLVVRLSDNLSQCVRCQVVWHVSVCWLSGCLTMCLTQCVDGRLSDSVSHSACWWSGCLTMSHLAC